MVKYTCPKCQAWLESPSSLAGQHDECPLCHAKVLVPRAQPSRRRWLVLGGCTVGLVLAGSIALIFSAGTRRGPTGSSSVAHPAEDTKELLSQYIRDGDTRYAEGMKSEALCMFKNALVFDVGNKELSKRIEAIRSKDGEMVDFTGQDSQAIFKPGFPG